MADPRQEYQDLLWKHGTNSYTDDQLVDLHHRLVDAGSHDGILLCQCMIVQNLFQRWYKERYDK